MVLHGLACRHAGRGLLGFLAKGLAAFRAVDAFQANVGLLAALDDDDRVAVLDAHDFGGERLGGSQQGTKDGDTVHGL
jgi:hypothetical protein